MLAKSKLDSVSSTDLAADDLTRPSVDLYRLDPRRVEEPPQTLFASIRRIGPGMILAATIVGSGELIVTTTLGALVGYVALWVIVVSCITKAALQAEWGRFTIASGETSLESVNSLPGPRWKVNWVVWLWALMLLTALVPLGAMYGAVAQILGELVPAVPRGGWLAALLGLSLMLLLGGGYNRVERLAMFKVAFFTVLTFLCALLLTRMPQYFSWDRVLDGFRFQLPADGVTTALAVFGITGVGATELFMYPYWCVEKGYARFTGPRQSSDAWRERANGWVRVMHIDVLVSMAIYTLATMAFYLLGAGILHGMGLVPRGTDLIGVLSNVYTQTLGGWAIWLFYSSALVTLYGTVLAATAAHARCSADLCYMLGWFERHDYEARTRTRNRLIVVFAIVPVVLYWLVESPVKMVVFGGAVQAAMLPVIAASVLYLRHRRLPKEVAPSRVATVWLWFCSLLLVFAVAYALVP
jgi:Mn2+/Fe2+ NRAMP family transporter